MSDYLIKEETLNNLANSVRTLSGSDVSMTPDEMITTVNETKGAIDALEEHKNDETNPHNVTAEQVGAASIAEVNNIISKGGNFKTIQTTFNDDDSITELLIDDSGVQYTRITVFNDDIITETYKLNDSIIYTKTTTFNDNIITEVVS